MLANNFTNNIVEDVPSQLFMVFMFQLKGQLKVGSTCAMTRMALQQNCFLNKIDSYSSFNNTISNGLKGLPKIIYCSNPTQNPTKAINK
jgi:hypothetical protein